MLNNVTEIARQAGDLILRVSGAKASMKAGRFNFVTDTDIAVQTCLQEKLSLLLPQSSFFAEEKENAALTDAPTWVVDPIDGTMNFMRGRRCSCISIALLISKLPVLGVIYNPYSCEMFTAERGKGAFLNNEDIHVSQVSMKNALVTFGTSTYDETLAGDTMLIASEFLKVAGDLRRTGSAAIDLADIACGRSDIFFELKLSPWDYSAGALLVEEAGGCFLMPSQRQARFSLTTGILACNMLCREAALRILCRPADNLSGVLK